MALGELLGGLFMGAGQGVFGLVQSAMNYAFSKEAQERQYKYTRKLTRYNWNLNTLSQNTAHQREVSDLRAAGLNPILSATGGTGAGGVSTGVGGTVDTSGTAHAFDNVLSSALDLRRLRNETQLNKSQVELNDKNVEVAEEQQHNLIQDRATSYSNMLKTYQDIENSKIITDATAYKYRAEADSQIMNALTNRILGNSQVTLNSAEAKYTDERSRGYSYSTHGPFGTGHSSTGNESTLYSGPSKLYNYFSNPDNYHYETEVVNGKKVRVKVYH